MYLTSELVKKETQEKIVQGYVSQEWDMKQAAHQGCHTVHQLSVPSDLMTSAGSGRATTFNLFLFHYE